MTLQKRTATATNYHLFEGGDSKIQSPTLLGALQEVTELLDATILDYNQNNPTLLYPDITVNYDAGVCTSAIPVPYRKVGGVKTSVDYLNPYSGWTTPTTGELVGITNILDAYLYILDAVGDGNDALRPGLIIQSAKTTTTNTDDAVAKEVQTSFNLPYDTVTDPVTGKVSKVFQDYFTILDGQLGFPI
jgi:hypothetical protein